MVVDVRIVKKDFMTNTYSIIGKGQGIWKDKILTCTTDDIDFMRIETKADEINCYHRNELELRYSCKLKETTTMVVKNELGEIELEIYTHSLLVKDNEVTVDYEMVTDEKDRFVINWSWWKSV